MSKSPLVAAFDKVGVLSALEEEQYGQARRKMLGNIKFICEYIPESDWLHAGCLYVLFFDV